MAEGAVGTEKEREEVAEALGHRVAELRRVEQLEALAQELGLRVTLAQR